MSLLRSALALSALAFGTLAHAGTWNLDASHSRVGFRVKHMMVSSVEGQFTDVSGTLQAEPGDLKNASVEVTVQMASVDTSNEDRDNHLRADDFFGVEAHPTMTFVSRKFKAKKDGSFEIVGDLTIRGNTKSVTFTGEGLGQSITDPWGNERMGATATATIDRQDFGVKYSQVLDQGGLAVGNDVKIQLDVEFVRAQEEQASK